MGELTRLTTTTSAAPLWRDLVGAQLRVLRVRRGDRLVDVAGRAGVSPQYLSEVERGIKDPSSELLAAIALALDTDVVQLARRVVLDLASLDTQQPRRLIVSAPTVRAASGGSPVCLAA